MTSSDKLELRETDVWPLAQLGQEFIFPERIRVQLNPDVRTAPIDIGSFAYTSRAVTLNSREAHFPIRVDVSTLLVSRRELVRGIADYFFSNGRRDTTIITDFKNFKFVLDWCDANGYSDWATDVESAALAYAAYSDYLRHSILVTEEIRPATAAERQRALQRLAELCFPNQSLHVVRGVPMIKNSRTPKKPPEEDEVRNYVKVCLDLATQLSDFVLNEKEYPFKVQIAGGDAVFFPSHVGTIGPYTPVEKIPPVYDVAKVRVATRDEVVAKGKYTSAASAVKDAQSAIDRANSDPRSVFRLILASLAMGAYSCLFSIITAANPSEFVQFEYLDGLEIERSMVKKEFTSIKFRANGKVTRYAIGRRSGLDLLRSYLKLREWILDGAHCKYLFFTMRRDEGSYTGDFGRLDTSYSFKFFKRIKGTFFPPQAKNIPGGLARKLKSLVLHELRVSAKSIAEALNHAPATNAKSYSETTPARQKQEFGEYWQAVRKAADAVRDQESKGETSTAAGHCDDFTHPVRIVESAPIEPNCKTQYGCLFCENYVCHADEEDAHKLLSLQYVANAVRDFSTQVEHSDALFRELTVRINYILEKVSERSLEHKAMVNNMRRRVNDLGELTPYWESRLQRYERAGVVF